MSIRITCLKELKEKRILEYNYVVEFTVKEQIIRYKVKEFFLQNLNEDILSFNNEIFKILEINEHILARKIYKYIPKNIFRKLEWPETEPRDYSSLTRIVKELYEIIEKREPVFTKFTRFEIMEI